MHHATFDDAPSCGLATKLLVGLIALALVVLVAEIVMLKRSHNYDAQSRVNNPAYWRTLAI